MDKSHEYQFDADKIAQLEAENAALREQLVTANRQLRQQAEAVASTVNRHHEELAAAQKDAERYRWLRDGAINCDMARLESLEAVSPNTAEELDAAIDAAIEKEKAE